MAKVKLSVGQAKELYLGLYGRMGWPEWKGYGAEEHTAMAEELSAVINGFDGAIDDWYYGFKGQKKACQAIRQEWKKGVQK